MARPTGAVVFDPEAHCGAKARGGNPCVKPKGWGTTHAGDGRCKQHGGASPQAERLGALRVQEKRLVAIVASLGLTVEKDPQTALLEAVWEAAGNVAFLRQEVQALGTALIGDTLGIAQREGVAIPIGEEQRAIVKLYGEWTDRLVKYSKAAIDAGIAERQVKLAEAQGYAIRDLIEAVLAGMDVSEEQRALGREIAGTQLRVLGGGAAA